MSTDTLSDLAEAALAEYAEVRRAEKKAELDVYASRAAKLLEVLERDLGINPLAVSVEQSPTAASYPVARHGGFRFTLVVGTVSEALAAWECRRCRAGSHVSASVARSLAELGVVARDGLRAEGTCHGPRKASS